MRNSVLFFLVHLSLSLPAQTHQHINTDQGLLTNMLTTVIRDKNNFMWIGSYNGLHRHEGSRIRLYKKVGKDSLSISGSEMHGLFEDRQGFIWIGTTNGLDKIDPVTGHIVHYPLRSMENTSAVVGYIYSVFQDKYDSIWASTDAAIYRMDYRSGKYITIPRTVTAKGIPTSITGYKSGIPTSRGIWMYTSNGLSFYDYASRKFFHRNHNPENKAVFRTGVPGKDLSASSDMVTDKDSNMFFIINHAFLGRYNLKSEQLDSFQLPRPSKAWKCCYSLATDSRNNIWIGTRHGGILVFNNRSSGFTPIRFVDNNSLISSNYVYSMCEDYRGRMWITTDRGLDMVDLYNSAVEKKFLSNSQDFTNLIYMSGNITADSSFIYVPFFDGGLMRVNQVTGKINHWPLHDTSIGRINYVFPGEKGLIASTKKGLARIEIQQGGLVFSKLRTAYSPLLERTPGEVVWIYQHSKQAIYFKKTNGTLYYYNGTGTLEKIASDGFKHMACVSRDGKFLYYIDSNLNLAKRNLQSLSTTTFFLQEKLKKIDFLFSNPRDLADDGKGNIWITSQNGLLRYQENSGKLFTYTTAEGLSHSFTYALATDKQGRTWVSSLGGVDLYNAVTDRFLGVTNYSSGTYMDAFGSSILLPNGNIYFHSGNKLFLITPDSFLKQKPVPLQLKITEVLVNGRALDWQKNGVLNGLSYSQNRLEFQFSLLEFYRDPNLKYFYYLEGIEKDWIESSRADITYNSLPPGKYIFHVKAVDAAGIVIDQQISLPVVIRPPFWKTWWFRFLSLGIIVYVLSFLFKRRIRAIKEKASFRQQMSELEARALRAQMNPHFIFNCLNAIQELIVTKNVTDAYLYLSRFSKLLRMVLNNSEKNFISLNAEIEMNRLYLELESLRFKQSFHHEIIVENNIDEETIQVPSLLLQPFLENAIWHGLIHKEGYKKLSVIFKEDRDRLVCTIEDNGVGREKAQQIKSGKIGAGHFESKGMALTQQRIDTLNTQLKETMSIKVEDLKDENKVPSGTRVTIILQQI